MARTTLIIWLMLVAQEKSLKFQLEMHGDRTIIEIFSALIKKLHSERRKINNGNHQPREHSMKMLFSKTLINLSQVHLHSPMLMTIRCSS
jgi:hypothetical protein